MLKEMTLYGEVDKVKVAINRLKLHAARGLLCGFQRRQR